MSLQWKRTASLLGNRAVEEALQDELIDRFPPHLFPLDIAIVGNATGGGAIVLLRQLGVGIDKEIVVEFPRSRFNKAILLAAVSDLISELGTLASSTSLRPQTVKRGCRAIGSIP